MKTVVITLTAVLACFAGGVQPRAESAASNDVAVLGAVIGNWSKGGDGSYYVLSSQTVRIDDFNRKAISGTAEARNLLERNIKPSQLPTMPPREGVRVVPEEQIIAALKAKGPPVDPPQPGWEGFYSRYPGAQGVLRVSLPGYTPDGTEAVVMLSVGCGSLCGSGLLLHLERSNGEWKIVRRETLWVS